MNYDPPRPSPLLVRLTLGYLSSGHSSHLSRDIVHTFEQGVCNGNGEPVVTAVFVEGRTKRKLPATTACLVASHMS